MPSVWVAYLQNRDHWRCAVVVNREGDPVLIVDSNLALVTSSLATFVVQRLPVSERPFVGRLGHEVQLLPRAFNDSKGQAKLMRPFRTYEGESLVGEHDLHTVENISLFDAIVNDRLNARR